MSDVILPDGDPRPAVSAAREKAVEVLKHCFTRGLYDLEEYEGRVGRVEHAANLAEIDSVLSDIPAEVRATSLAPSGVSSPSPPISRNPQSIRTVMGSRSYRGNWLSSRSLQVKSVMAETVLDFRNLELPAETIDVDVVCVMTSLEILVPPSIRVEVDASPVFANVEERGSYRPEEHRGTLRVRGTIVFANLEIRYR